jgi:hypothetical protein
MDATIGVWMIKLPRSSVIARVNLAIPRVSAPTWSVQPWRALCLWW